MAVNWEEKRNEFLNVFDNNIGNRQGKDELRDWLLSEENDFFTAPASSRYHGAYEGGLCEHSLDVYYMAVKIANAMEEDIKHQYAALNRKYDKEQFMESLTVAALFHDICKVNFYTVSSRNVKNKKTGQWESKPFFIVDERFPFGGHGSKSVYILQYYLRDLKKEEAIAINCHMGFSDAADHVNAISQSFHFSPLAWIIHVADEAAIYLIEERNEVEED